MEQQQTTRQQKIARQIQRDIAEILQKECRGLGAGAMITVTTVRVSPDFAYAKIYFSIFPFDRNAAVMEELEKNTGKTYEKLYIVGGGAKNLFLNRLTAEATGKEVIALPIEATALGNLMIQMKGC